MFRCVLSVEKRESRLLRFSCVFAGEERDCCLGLVMFLLGKRELVA